MGGQDDLKDALRALVAAQRKDLGEPPTPEELLAWRDGRLNPAERERLEARIAVYPEAARTLADLAAFPAIEPAPGVPDVSAEEAAARWQSFRRRIAEAPAPRSTVPEALRETPVIPLRAETRADRTVPVRWLAAAASVTLAVGLGGGFLAGRGSLEPAPNAEINVEIAELRPAGEGGSRTAASAVDLPEGAEGLVLILGLDDPGELSGYAAEIVDAQGSPVWSRGGLLPTPLGTFQLSFRRGVLGPGEYRIHLYGQEGAERRRLARYELRIAEGADTP